MENTSKDMQAKSSPITPEVEMIDLQNTSPTSNTSHPNTSNPSTPNSNNEKKEELDTKEKSNTPNDEKKKELDTKEKPKSLLSWCITMPSPTITNSKTPTTISKNTPKSFRNFCFGSSSNNPTNDEKPTPTKGETQLDQATLLSPKDTTKPDKPLVSPKGATKPDKTKNDNATDEKLDDKATPTQTKLETDFEAKDKTTKKGGNGSGSYESGETNSESLGSSTPSIAPIERFEVRERDEFAKLAQYVNYFFTIQVTILVVFYGLSSFIHCKYKWIPLQFSITSATLNLLFVGWKTIAYLRLWGANGYARKVIWVVAICAWFGLLLCAVSAGIGVGKVGCDMGGAPAPAPCA